MELNWNEKEIKSAFWKLFQSEGELWFATNWPKDMEEETKYFWLRFLELLEKEKWN